jgi:chemotaxis protein methyltransferase CheR
MPASMRDRWFERDGECFRIVAPLHSAVRFAPHNLASDPIPPTSAGTRAWDLILCRNVLMYWDHDRAAKLLENLGSTLSADGLLFLGAAESLDPEKGSLQSVLVEGRLAYRPAGAQRRLAPVPALAGYKEQALPARAKPVRPASAPPQPASKTSSSGYEQARQRFAAGDARAARTTLQAWLQEQPDHILGHVMMGNLHLREHELAEALDAYERAHAVDPLLAEAHYLTGVVNSKAADLQRAEAAFRRALFLDPSFWPAAFLLARICQKQGNAEAAAREYHRVLQAIESTHTDDLFQSDLLDLDILEVPRHAVAKTCREALCKQARSQSGRDADGSYHRRR